MRNFIVSDLHGDGNIYNSIISYLENLSKDSNEEIMLHINGDLIDRGYACAEMLLDVRDRILNKKGNIKINYLAGNHELMMYQDSINLDDRYWPVDSLWFFNGGYKTAYDLEAVIDANEYKEVVKFISNLKLYHKFTEELNGKKIVLAHSKCPTKVLTKCDLTVKDDNKEIHDIVWTRKDYNNPNAIIGSKKYFTIIGHTPLFNNYGYYYDKEEDYLNIDGGCAAYVMGNESIDHVPLVEIDGKNNKLIILIFNNNNEIIYGNYLKDGKITNIRNLDKYRKYLNKDIKLKKMVLYDGDVIFE